MLNDINYAELHRQVEALAQLPDDQKKTVPFSVFEGLVFSLLLHAVQTADEKLGFELVDLVETHVEFRQQTPSPDIVEKIHALIVKMENSGQNGMPVHLMYAILYRVQSKLWTVTCYDEGIFYLASHGLALFENASPDLKVKYNWVLDSMASNKTSAETAMTFAQLAKDTSRHRDPIPEDAALLAAQDEVVDSLLDMLNGIGNLQTLKDYGYILSVLRHALDYGG
jgi:hypothetical protein